MSKIFFWVWQEEKYTALKGIQKKCILVHFVAIAENPVGHPLHHQVAENVFYDKKACQFINISDQIGRSYKKLFFEYDKKKNILLSKESKKSAFWCIL